MRKVSVRDKAGPLGVQMSRPKLFLLLHPSAIWLAHRLSWGQGWWEEGIQQLGRLNALWGS